MGPGTTTLQALTQLIQEKYGIDPATINPDLSMRDQGLDSLAVAEFLFEVEDKFALSLPSADLNIETLAQLADLVEAVKRGDADPMKAVRPPPPPAVPVETATVAPAATGAATAADATAAGSPPGTGGA